MVTGCILCAEGKPHQHSEKSLEMENSKLRLEIENIVARWKAEKERMLLQNEVLQKKLWLVVLTMGGSIAIPADYANTVELEKYEITEYRQGGDGPYVVRVALKRFCDCGGTASRGHLKSCKVQS